MVFNIIPFAHDYYIIYLPLDQNKMVAENRETFFGVLKYQECLNYKSIPIKFAPVIRLYGMQNGIQSCLHVHGYFPYFYIKIEEMKHLFQDNDFVISFIDSIHKAYVSLFYQKFDSKSKQGSFQLIYRCELVYCRDFYGFHSQEECFLQIYLFDKQYIRQLVQLLHSGAILNYSFQPYESHISYFTHFYADIGMFGMTPLQSDQVVLRRRLPKQLEIVLDSTGRGQLFLDVMFKKHLSSKLSKLSSCLVELDCHYSSLQNQDFIEQREFLGVIKQINAFNSQSNLFQEFNVELTLTLTRLWKDESNRRERMKKPQLKQLIDRRDNREAMEGRGCDFPSVNIIASSRIKEHFLDFQSSEQMPPLHTELKQCFINTETVQNFFLCEQGEIVINICQSHQKQTSHNSIVNRFGEYKKRKKDLFDLIKIQGNIDYEFNIRLSNEDDSAPFDLDLEDDEDEDDLREIMQSSQQLSKNINVFDLIKKNQQLIDKNKYRKKYVVSKNKKKGAQFIVFEICKFCSKPYFECICLAQESHERIPIKLRIGDEQSYIYKHKAPNMVDVLQSLKEMNMQNIPQYVYYSQADDIYKHYGINNKRISKSQFYVQYLDRLVQKSVNQSKFYVPSIADPERLPNDFYLEPIMFKKFNNQPYDFEPCCYLYQNIPPKVKDLLEEIEAIDKQSNKSRLPGHLLTQDQSQSTTEPNQNEEEIDNLDLIYMGIECFISCVEDRLPNPTFDPIVTATLCIYSFYELQIVSQCLIIVDEVEYQERVKKEQIKTHSNEDLFIVQNEVDLLKLLSLLVLFYDPDLVGGWDLEQQSLGYIVRRANENNIDILASISRSKATHDDLIRSLEFDEFVYEVIQGSNLETRLQEHNNLRLLWNQIIPPYSSKMKINFKQINPQINTRAKRSQNISIGGRVLMNIWRFAQTDLKLNDYSIENVSLNVLKIKIPKFENKTLSQWFNNYQMRYKTLKYLQERCVLATKVLVCMDTVPRGVEIARLFGCDFESIGQRGSQFKIESVLCRVTKQSGYLLFTATRLQVSQQKIMQSCPLVLEPPKMLVVDPVVVLDFQSLYPSLMIAYNLCFSTCLGNVDEIIKYGKKRFGVAQTNIDFSYLLKNYSQEQLLQHDILVTPNNVAFVQRQIQEGIIPKILAEFLQTRIMIKKSSKMYPKNQQAIQKLCSFRQLALKLFMNVMYGYCGASFSGRMPSGDIADSVVELGRTILNQCVNRIKENKEWRAEVLYGDTDSLFVVLRGRTNEDAFILGEQIAKIITADYPYPMELKFEKVYNPLVLLAKKRYVGYKQERVNQVPEFEAKGVEIVRRDGCQATVKVMKKTLKLIFQQKDLSELKTYMHKLWAKIMNGYFGVNDFVIAKEVKLGKYKKNLPAHAMAATKAMEKDPMKAPKYAERIKYVVIQGTNEKTPIRDMVATLDEFLANPHYKINSLYYVKKHINAALGRIFSTFDVDIDEWFMEMPKGLAKRGSIDQQINLKSFTLHNFYNLMKCILCSKDSSQEICTDCLSNSTRVLVYLGQKQQILEQDYFLIRQMCRACSQLQGTNMEIEDVPCIEYNCSLVESRIQTKRKLIQQYKSSNRYIEVINLIQ